MEIYILIGVVMAVVVTVWQALSPEYDSYGGMALYSIVAGVLWPYMLVSWCLMGLIGLVRRIRRRG